MYSVRMLVFSRNAGKYRPEKLQIRTLFTQCYVLFVQQDELTKINLICWMMIKFYFPFDEHLFSCVPVIHNVTEVYFKLFKNVDI